MSLFDVFKRTSAADGKAGGAMRQNGDATARPRITYNCKLCGVASSIRGVVYDHLKNAHSEVIDRNGNINEHREDEPRPQV